MKNLINALDEILCDDWDIAFKTNLTWSLEARADVARAREKLCKMLLIKEQVNNDTKPK